ncbi:hypothetical protein LTR22_026341 [Elasticomyces elasticus]|nr:hypothetical protein LTR22_026341 [Elasticomyces elasticus]
MAHDLQLLFAALFLGVVALPLIALHRLRSPLNRIPGPWYARWTSIPLKVATLSGRRIYHVHALHARYGSYVRVAPGEIAVNDAASFKKIHRVGSPFEKSTWYRDLLSIGRPILFTMVDQHAHAARRRLFAKAFSKSHIRANWEAVVSEKIALAIFGMAGEATTNISVDILQWWTWMASDVSAHLMFGESFHTLEGSGATEYLDRLQTGLIGMGIGAEMPLVRALGRSLPFPVTQRLFAVNEFLLKYAKTAMQRMKNSGAERNIFAAILSEAEAGEKIDEPRRLMIAGTDTTAITLTYLIWAVLSQDTLRQNLRAELGSVPESVLDADLGTLPLLNAAIEETLRMYGALPGALPRTVPAGGVEMDGYLLPRGTTVTTQSYSLHRDPELFPNPDRFEVSRWLDLNSGENKYRVTETAKAVFSPWGAGARTCLGVHIAYMELRLAAAAFFRAFPDAHLAASTTPKSMQMENHFLIRPVAHRCEVILYPA